MPCMSAMRILLLQPGNFLLGMFVDVFMGCVNQLVLQGLATSLQRLPDSVMRVRVCALIRCGRLLLELLAHIFDVVPLSGHGKGPSFTPVLPETSTHYACRQDFCQAAWLAATAPGLQFTLTQLLC